MDGKNETDKIDDEMLPGFRFHPTDEELVGFYLKKKIQQRSLPIELIKQVDIYKYDPWDLPNLASTGEKEWYFYCPRDRKYRNSARPNRVTGAGFWKATGTDRPIYSSDGTKCIGLKKSLVFYRGRAAKGMKTDWMMHEFRLPSIPDSGPPKKLLDKNLPPNDSWAICRIFKKTNSMAQRALSHSWIFPENSASDMFSQGTHSQFSPDNRSCTAETGSGIHLCHTNELQLASADSLSALDIPTFRSINPTICKFSPYSISQGDFPKGFMFSPPEMSVPISNCTTDVASMFFNLSPDLLGDASTSSERIEFGGPHQPFNSFPMNSPQDMQGSISTEDDDASLRKNYSPAEVNNQWGNIRSTGFPFSLPPSTPVDAWKLNLPWDTPPRPSEMSGTYSTSVIPRHSDSFFELWD